MKLLTIMKQLLAEGVYDPGIFKAIFLAGGPGSGKSFVSNNIFGLGNSSFSAMGLKLINSDSEFEHELAKMNIDTKQLDQFHSENPERYDSIRNRAKVRTSARKGLYSDGRLGLIIDGTGHDYTKIKKQMVQLESIGYDCFMIFVNTSLEVALQRNTQRQRVVPTNVVTGHWHEVQNNLGKFQSLFKSNFLIVDNTDLSTFENIKPSIVKAVDKFIKSPIKNIIAANWIKNQMDLKNTK